MKLVKPSYEILEQEPSLEGVYRAIERAGRTCYKSEDKITEDSAKKFVDMLIARGHTSCLEHGTVYLRVDDEYDWYDLKKYVNYPWVKYKIFYSGYTDDIDCVYITSNYRWIIENNLEDYLEYLCEPTEYHEKRISVKFTSNIHFYKDITRHRLMSFAIESTRYCNYSQGKFGNELTFISPVWANEEELEKYYFKCPGIGECPEDVFIYSLERAEEGYLELLKQGWKPEHAAELLPQATKADIIMTGFVSDWNFIFDLRARGKFIDSKGEHISIPHPEVIRLMKPLEEEFVKRGLINDC